MWGMQMKSFLLARKAILICAMFFLSPSIAAASSETVLYNFSVPVAPYGRLLGSGTGAFYGSSVDGENGYGDAYQLRQKRGVWNLREVVQFAGGSDGRF